MEAFPTTSVSAGKLWGLRRMADEMGHFRMLAVDQRPPIKGPIAAHYGTQTAPYADVARVKAELIRALQPAATALLLDPHYAVPVGLRHMSPAKGLILTLEDSAFRETEAGRFSAEIDGWSVEKIKRCGGDAVKVLAWYRPDAGAAALRAQQDFVRRTGDACARLDIPFLFELLVYPLAGDRDRTGEYREMQGKRAEHVLDSVAAFADADYGVDVFKLEAPVEAVHVPPLAGQAGDALEEAADPADVQALFRRMGEIAARPWVMLSAGASKDAFVRVLEHAYEAGASGYLAGRAIWLEAFGRFPDWNAMRTDLETNSRAYMERLNALTTARAKPWFESSAYGGQRPEIVPADGSFRFAYEDFSASERFEP